MASTIAPKALARAPALAQALVAPPDFLPGSACSQSLDWDRSLQLAGSPRRRLARQQGQLPAVLSVRSLEAGVSEADAHSYAEGVRRGGTLVSARVADAERSRLDTILNESAVNLRERSAAWQKAGWKSFDASSKPYGAEEVRKERALYDGGPR